MTGISDSLRAPENPDILIETELGSPQESARVLLQGLEKMGFKLWSPISSRLSRRVIKNSSATAGKRLLTVGS